MAYLNEKSINKSQDINHNQSVELNTETVEQLRRLLSLLVDLNLVDFPEDLTAESTDSQEDIDFQETTVNQTENHHNSTHQNINDFPEDLTAESINSQEDIDFQETAVNQTENHQNSIHQNINDFPEDLTAESTDSQEDIDFQETAVNQTENHHNSTHQSITKHPEQNQQNITGFSEDLTGESTDSQEDIDFQETAVNQTENHHNSTHQSITGFSEDLTAESINSQEDIDFQETAVNQTENHQNSIHQRITKHPEQNQQNINDFSEDLTAESTDSQEDIDFQETTVNQTENHQNSTHQRITGFSEDLTAESINSQEDIDFQETAVNQTENHQNSTHQRITKQPEEDQDNIINVEGKSTNNQAEEPGIEKPLLAPQKLPELSDYRQQYDAELEAFEDLQNILFGSQLARLIRKLNTSQGVKKFNYNQDEFNNVLTPLFSQNLQLGQTEAEVIETIAPVIDRAIQKRFRQDRQAITSSLAPLLAPSIETQIKREPQAMADAIAPIIDIIITKKTEQDQQAITSSLAPLLAPSIEAQIKQEPQAMADAIAPIIDIIITKKTEQDQQSVSEVLAPLLPVAISSAIQNYPQEIAKALAPEMGAAIREQIRIDPRQISQALAPEMGRAIKDQITLEPNSIVDALYPVMGSTISKYMTQEIREINDKISETFSFKGIRRKIQAIFQGVSEAELIISEVMIFTVQAVFLIHKESGLVISEVQHSRQDRLESEMLAGMLTAIRSFVNDCIAQSGDFSELNEIEYGDSKIILEVAGYCYLAVVIRGQTNKSFIKELRKILSKIVIDYGKYIKIFAGDPDTIPASIQLLLKSLMDIENVQENQKLQISKPPTALLIVCGLILSLIFIPWGIYQYYSRLYRGIEARTREAWSNIPELAIYRIGAKVKRGSLILTGQLPNQNLRNRAAKIAKKQASPYNLEVHNQITAVRRPQDASEISDEVDRLTRVLNQMEGVSISTEYGEGRVTVKGTVMDMADSQIIIRKIEQVPGVKSVISTTKLSPLKLKTRIYFDLGSAKLHPVYIDTMAQIQEFLTQYPQKHLRIIGHTDRTGNPNINEQLALERSYTVRDALVKQGVDARRLEVTGQTNSPQGVEYNQPLLLSRCVTFDLFEPSEKDN
ncbi:MAG: OmpA family protein [Okeania sp. SIO2G4]|uniref:OmpA family protein n=1 Tax=unclassified Okeania TaxID=2634635 RepID=UPI0013B5C718|nr:MULTISPECIES: OmpA family protein [unclassified Okeania]NEP73062.1 OmpA family protein [Okeania sp. SIO2G5]NEP93925.1 OmpA family protein [Okeania sp. SIO2F5]NEQ91747.1 OmpA family protein [Okeania sp. SIO2G4]